MTDWRLSLLQTLGMPATRENLQFLDSWQRWEGGSTANNARFNWLNTTHGDGTPINSVGVKAFGSYAQGIKSLSETLQNGRYDDILTALSKGNPYAYNVSSGLQTWVSGRPDGNPAYAAKVLGQPAPPLKLRATAFARSAKQAMAAVPQGMSWATLAQAVFHDDPETAALMAALDDPTAQASGIVSPGGSIQPFDVGGLKVGKPVLRSLTTAAAQQLGKPYVFGSGPDTNSFDCSDLIQWAYKQVGVALPRTTFDQIKVGRSVKGKALQPGDLVFPSNHHVVMYVGNGKVIAAPHTGTVVQYQPISKFGRPVDVRRVL